MKHVKTLNGATLKNSAAHGGCGECQTSCQSACKTSCTVANQKCAMIVLIIIGILSLIPLLKVKDANAADRA